MFQFQFHAIISKHFQITIDCPVKLHKVTLYYLLCQVMDPADVIPNSPRDRVFGLSELYEKIFSYLDPNSVKAAALVCK